MKKLMKTLPVIMMFFFCLKITRAYDLPAEVSIKHVGGGQIIGSNGYVMYDDHQSFGMWTTADGSSPVLCGDAGIESILETFSDYAANRQKYGYTVEINENNTGGTIVEVTDINIIKIIWYGWLGPGDNGGFTWKNYNYLVGSNGSAGVNNGSPYKNSTDMSASAITQTALSAYRATISQSKQQHDFINARGVRAYLNYVNSKPDELPLGFHVYQLITNHSHQDFFWYEYDPAGTVKIEKKSSAANLTDLLPEYYSLEGAVYGIYGSDDELITTLTTDENGKSETYEIAAGTYLVREITPSPGYKLDDNTYEITVTADENTVLEVNEEPLFLTADILIRKMGKEIPLENAVFKVVHVYGQATLREWYFRSDREGLIRLNDDYRVSGDELYEYEGEKILLPGTYRFCETEAPEGYLPCDDFETEIETDEEHTVFNELIIEDDPVPSISTKAGRKPVLQDTVYLSDLTVGREYTLRTSLIDKNSGRSIKKQEMKFTATGEEETVQIVMDIDEQSLTGKTLVFCEDLYLSERCIASHRNMEDENQTVRYPSITTQVNDSFVLNEKGEIITDVITYQSFEAGKTYRVVSRVMDKESLDVVSQKESLFTCTSDNGVFSVEIEINGRENEGKIMVVYEDVYLEDELICSHSDINDLKQTVYVPKMETAAVRMEGSFEGEYMIVDSMSYEGFPENEEFTVICRAYDLDEEVILEEKEVVMAGSKGTMEISISLETGEIDGHSIVLTEEVMRGDRIICEHNDLGNERQTVILPAISTRAEISEAGIVSDTVSYKGLMTGCTYEITGKLFYRETGEPVCDSSGQETFAKIEFTPDSSQGEIIVSFESNYQLRENEDVVVCEYLYENGKLLIAHEDLDDASQTVKYLRQPATGDSSFGVYQTLLMICIIASAGIILRYLKESL